MSDNVIDVVGGIYDGYLLWYYMGRIYSIKGKKNHQ